MAIALLLLGCAHFAYAMTSSELVGNCVGAADSSGNTPSHIWTEGDYTYMLVSTGLTSLTSWNSAVSLCSSMLANQGIQTSLASYRSSSVQSTFEETATLSYPMDKMFIGITDSSGSPTWLDPSVNSIYPTTNVVEYVWLYGCVDYSTLKYNDIVCSMPTDLVIYACEVKSKFA
jgi:hypothetical protein